ncbi:MAG: hypothetical protein MHMPM18_004325 [Marteilia pararefringens]
MCCFHQVIVIGPCSNSARRAESKIPAAVATVDGEDVPAATRRCEFPPDEVTGVISVQFSSNAPRSAGDAKADDRTACSKLDTAARSGE